MKSKFNGYLVASICIVGASFYLLNDRTLAPYLEDFAELIGLEDEFAWVPVAGLCSLGIIGVYSLLHRHLRTPLREIARQCAVGQIDGADPKVQTRDTRVIFDFLRQSEKRAQGKIGQMEKMEADLQSLRTERDRGLQKIEEQEDVISSYSRIRTELSMDNTSLRRENRSLEEQVRLLRQKLTPPSSDSNISYADKA